MVALTVQAMLHVSLQHTDSTDFVCPNHRCPAQPAFGVLFWQGTFYSSTPLMSDRSLNCIRRISFAGNMMTVLQVPISSVHPASSAKLNIHSQECPGFARSGVLKFRDYRVSWQYNLNLTSEGHDVSILLYCVHTALLTARPGEAAPCRFAQNPSSALLLCTPDSHIQVTMFFCTFSSFEIIRLSRRLRSLYIFVTVESCNFEWKFTLTFPDFSIYEN